ncbi:hypothetical protein YC2023_122020 [Brassica napus]
MEPGGCSQGESRPEGVESDRRERWAQSGWVKVTAGSSPYAHKAQLDEFPTCLDFQDTLASYFFIPTIHPGLTGTTMKLCYSQTGKLESPDLKVG